MLFSIRVDKDGNINVAQKKSEIIPDKKENQSIVDDQDDRNSSIKLEMMEIKLEKEQKETNDPENVTRTPEGNSVLLQRTNVLETPLENNEPKTKDMSEIYQKQVEERNLEEKNEREVVQDLRGIPEL